MRIDTNDNRWYRMFCAIVFILLATLSVNGFKKGSLNFYRLSL